MNASDKQKADTLENGYPVDYRGYSGFSQAGISSAGRSRSEALAALERLVHAARDGEAMEQHDLEPGDRND